MPDRLICRSPTLNATRKNAVNASAGHVHDLELRPRPEREETLTSGPNRRCAAGGRGQPVVAGQMRELMSSSVRLRPPIAKTNVILLIHRFCWIEAGHPARKA